MKNAMRMLGFWLFALAFLAAPAYANQVDVTDTSGFGSAVQGPVTTTFSFFGYFTADVQTTVYNNAGVYTYVYQISNYTGGMPVDVFSIGSLNFVSSLNWGVVTSGTSAGVGLDSPDVTAFGAPSPGCNTGRNTGFLNCGPTLTFFFSDGSGTSGGLHNTGEYITIYAQGYSGAGPNLHSAILIDSDYATGNIPAPVPEPGTMALFGSGMISLAFAIRRKLLG